MYYVCSSFQLGTFCRHSNTIDRLFVNKEGEKKGTEIFQDVFLFRDSYRAVLEQAQGTW